MENLKKAIEWKRRWAGLMPYITLIEENLNSNPNTSLDATKSLLEAIAKTILNDKWKNFDNNSNIWKLIKQAFESLPIFVNLERQDSRETQKILWALSTITLAIWTFRNNHWFISHWNDLESKKFDRYLLNLAVSSCDVLSSFLVISHSEDLKDRSRIYYEECNEFNVRFDNGNISTIAWIEISASRALFDQDYEAYKEEYNSYQNNPSALIDALEIADNDLDKLEKITPTLSELIQSPIPKEDIQKFNDIVKNMINYYNKIITDSTKINTNLTEKINNVLKNILIISNDKVLQKQINKFKENINKLNNLEWNYKKNLKIEVFS